MSPKLMSLLLGGAAPAVLFGLASFFQKVSTKAGIGNGPFLIGTGLTTLAVGVVCFLIDRDSTVNARSAVYTIIYATSWSVAIACIAVAIRRYNGQISQLVPLYNMNTLVAVILGLVFLAEWRTVNPGRLLLASALIIAGGILAASS